MVRVVYNTIHEALESLSIQYTIVRREDGRAYVSVYAPNYENKAYRLPGTWSKEFSDAEIAKDACNILAQLYGIKKFTGYSVR